MARRPAIPSGPRAGLLVLALAAAGAVSGAALLLSRGPAPVQVDLVRVALPSGAVLFVQRTEVGLRDWARCHEAGGCSLSLRDPGDGQDYPATGISHVDAQEYLAWINRGPGPTYRLPTRDEWYAFADEVLPEAADPIFTAPELRWASSYLVEAPRVDRALHPTGAFSTTSAGVRDLDGNVWEWTSDCYSGAGSAPDRCPAFVMGGLHESVMFYLVRDPANGGCASGLPPAHLGFRLVTDDTADEPA